MSSQGDNSSPITARYAEKGLNCYCWYLLALISDHSALRDQPLLRIIGLFGDLIRATETLLFQSAPGLHKRITAYKNFTIYHNQSSSCTSKKI
ncbi:hypothetical protein V495_02674 [Pseudogymnoascus sp. VKM F-4514 (FW-929)]|nr:hypothetical protein V495_02674 [Pseudogymnoascus sp. VKM F-4514 (FW-929)]KFY56811.1 hypothetical protein V497_05957 [Pseudogymnoascus sp. VKM F-4516 (FW-969)]